MQTLPIRLGQKNALVLVSSTYISRNDNLVCVRFKSSKSSAPIELKFWHDVLQLLLYKLFYNLVSRLFCSSLLFVNFRMQSKCVTVKWLVIYKVGIISYQIYSFWNKRSNENFWFQHSELLYYELCQQRKGDDDY